ncbi:MAG: GntR family transcriptional regulator [Lentisphaeria bacterium]|nr:GntR family transcriptional regulator [Lentisphaeria bacterium]
MEKIKNNIKKHIYSKLSAPDMLFSEHQLAADFGLKRGNVREILLGLEGEGVVKRMPQRGYSCVNYLETDIAVVKSVRRVVEFEAVRLAMDKANMEDYVRLALLIEDMEKAYQSDNTAAFVEADMQFHTTLVNASKDNFLIKIFSFMTSTVFHVNKEADHDIMMKESLEDHKTIFASLRNKDWQAMEKILQYHFR